MPISAEQFAQLLPLTSQWAQEQESHILRHGVSLEQSALGASALELAALAQLQQPQRVRLLRVSRIPEPQQKLLSQAARESGFITSRAAGLTLGHGVFLTEEEWGNRALLLHELTHVRQYEERGIENFLREYLWQCLTLGYENAPLELEAIEAARHLQR